MLERERFYIGGRWVEPAAARPFAVVDPATEEPIARIALGSAEDVDRAVAAARAAFEGWSCSTPGERAALFQRIIEIYRRRYEELVEAVSREMGAPVAFARGAQVAAGLGHLAEAAKVLPRFPFQEVRGSTAIVHEPVGVCALITPWNWPLNQVACKVAPALAAGCTMVLKPSELAPLSALLFAEILDEAGVPPGVFNLVNGDGATVGEALSAHAGVDMVSFTGSTRAGIAVARAAAATVKRVTQELGGKSANVVLDDADLARAVAAGVRGCFGNAGQSCNAPTRMLVPRAQHEAALEVARAAAAKVKVGAPFAEGTTMGPVVSRRQWERVQGLIQRGLEEGATLVTG
ncbi:MAG TPA: aldehyde dehydrogenase family protein, partial [Myxococcaceae bacterium]|nr:aldehyde dehydrogenase family protein [Myxococcaceae bacterium]